VIQVQGYSIRQEIGIGGMATVYLAVQTSLEREVALKVMTPALVSDPNFSRRFLMEARTLASLSHPNIVAVYDVGVTEQQLHYFSMQHLPGGDFAHRIKSGPPEPGEIARVVAGVARALGFAHLRGFVHRDVSPANILFDASDNPVLTDFGIARAVTRTSRLTNAGASVGTSHYMSPEQARGGNVDARSDLYSLGAVTYEALTGLPPFDGEDGFAIAYAHVFEPVPRLPAHLEDWQALIDRALAKDPAERFADSEQFVAAIEAVAAQSGFSVGLPVLRTTGLQEDFARLEARDALPSPPPTGAVDTAAMDAATAATLVQPVPELPVAATGSGRSIPIAAAVAIGVGVIGLAAAVLFGTRDPAGSVEGAQPVVSAPAALASARPTTTPPLQPVSTASDGSIAADTSLDPLTAVGEPGEPLLLEDDPAALQRAIDTSVQDPIASLLALARADLAAQRLGNPPGRNALERYRLALRLAERVRASADAGRARQGMVDIAAAYAELGERSLAAGKPQEFMEFTRRAQDIAGPLAEGAQLTLSLGARAGGLHDEAMALARQAAIDWKRDAARAAFERALLFDPASTEAQAGVRNAARIGAEGFVFRDPIGKGSGPEMVVATAAGNKLAIARNETTLAEFRAFWSDGGAAARSQRPACRDRESFFRSSRSRSFEAPGFSQTGRHPVVCIVYADAKAYVEWLSRKSGRRYRLPSAAEWLALTARSPAPTACKANLADASYRAKFRDNDALACDDGHAESAPTRSFEAAGAAVYDIAGNVREWVSDCAPGCREHTAMGSAWNSTADKADTSQREAFGVELASNTVGFRVVREID